MGKIRSAWDELRFYVKDLFASGADSVPVDDSLARTIKESTHVRGVGGGLPRATTERQIDLVTEGHERYVRSFEHDAPPPEDD